MFSDPLLLIIESFLILALLGAGWRIFKGPGMADRIIALDLFAAVLMAKLSLLAIVHALPSLLDVALAIAVIAFIATVAMARFLETADQIKT